MKIRNPNLFMMFLRVSATRFLMPTFIFLFLVVLVFTSILVAMLVLLMFFILLSIFILVLFMLPLLIFGLAFRFSSNSRNTLFCLQNIRSNWVSTSDVVNREWRKQTVKETPLGSQSSHLYNHSRKEETSSSMTNQMKREIQCKPQDGKENYSRQINWSSFSQLKGFGEDR